MLTEYIVVDLEMTGLKPARDKILEIGGVYVRDGQILEEFETLVNPGIQIPENVTELTGITPEMAAQGMDTKSAVAAFLEFSRGLPLVGHNIAYDYSFLKHGAVNHNLTLQDQVVDTLKLARTLLAEPEKKSLEALCVYFEIEREQEHRALEDAKAAAELLKLLMERFGAEKPELFMPKTMQYKVKKQGPITPRQKKYLKELANYHKITLSVEIEKLTKNEASRLTDQILSQYGRMN